MVTVFFTFVRTLQAGAAAALLLSPCEALANEFDILNEPTPTKNYVIDDANVLNKTTKKSVNDELSRLEVIQLLQRVGSSVYKEGTESLHACALALPKHCSWQDLYNNVRARMSRVICVLQICTDTSL